MNIGSSIILVDQTLTNVLYVPDFKFNLLSVAKLTRDLSCSVSFFPKFCVLQGLYSGRVIGIGKEDSGLYLLKDELTAVVGATIKAVNQTDLWHIRLGHPSLKEGHAPYYNSQGSHRCQATQLLPDLPYC